MPPNDLPAPKFSAFQSVSPVILSSFCDVLANNSNLPDSGRLSYAFRKAIYLEEIRWTISLATIKDINPGSELSVKMSLGRDYLMRNPVPVWLLGTTMAATQENGSGGDGSTYGNYRWRLPEPLYVEAGQVLVSNFSRGNDQLGSMHVQVTYVGRTVPPGTKPPGVIAVPYAAAFVTDQNVVYQQSNENHLFNPFDVPLRVQRLTGRVLQVQSGDHYATVAFTQTTVSNAANILLDDSWGGKMINNQTGISDAFDILRSAWTVDTLMPPKGIYNARIWNIPTNQRIHIGLIGVREEYL